MARIPQPDYRRRLAIGFLVALLLAAYAVFDAAREDALSRKLRTVDRLYHYVASPNQDDRPWHLGTGIDCIVLHATAESTLQSTIDTFESPASRVSAHFVVGKDGTVVMMVPLEKRAWHAGVSILGDRPNVNDFSVGIEIVNANDGIDRYTSAQYAAVARIIRRVRTCCDIPDNRIVSHASIALPPGRKSDPKRFDWPRLRRLLHRR